MNISNNFAGLSVDQASLLVNYIYLDTDEREEGLKYPMNI